MQFSPYRQSPQSLRPVGMSPRSPQVYYMYPYSPQNYRSPMVRYQNVPQASQKQLTEVHSLSNQNSFYCGILSTFDSRSNSPQQQTIDQYQVSKKGIHKKVRIAAMQQENSQDRSKILEIKKYDPEVNKSAYINQFEVKIKKPIQLKIMNNDKEKKKNKETLLEKNSLNKYQNLKENPDRSQQIKYVNENGICPDVLKYQKYKKNDESSIEKQRETPNFLAGTKIQDAVEQNEKNLNKAKVVQLIQTKQNGKNNELSQKRTVILKQIQQIEQQILLMQKEL